MSQTQQPEQHLDRVERSIDIDADAERVFDLVSRPGWWINQGEIDPDAEVTWEDDIAVVVHPQWGKFRIRPLASERPGYASFSWLDRDDTSVGTTVELWITERDGGVTLRVLESGFTTLGNSQRQVAEHIAENTEGWETELAAAARLLGRGAAPAGA